MLGSPVQALCQLLRACVLLLVRLLLSLLVAPLNLANSAAHSQEALSQLPYDCRCRCMHKAMDPFTPSHCPLCRSEYAHFPQVSCQGPRALPSVLFQTPLPCTVNLLRRCVSSYTFFYKKRSLPSTVRGNWTPQVCGQFCSCSIS